MSKAIEAFFSYLQEDNCFSDITTGSIVESPERDIKVKAVIIAKEAGIIAGLGELSQILPKFAISFFPKLKDGSKIKKNMIIAELHGNASKLLSFERVILNILMRMSGVATHAKKLAEICNKYSVKLAGTRKTTPGFRYFEKRAIEIAGAYAHRYSLKDAILIKDNHIAFLMKHEGDRLRAIERAIKLAREKNKGKEIEIEVASFVEAIFAAEKGAGIIMLDNFSLKEAEKTLKELEKRKLRDRVKVEISGGITLRNIESYAKLKPDFISSGSITMKAKSIDMSMEIL